MDTTVDGLQSADDSPQDRTETAILNSPSNHESRGAIEDQQISTQDSGFYDSTSRGYCINTAMEIKTEKEDKLKTDQSYVTDEESDNEDGMDDRQATSTDWYRCKTSLCSYKSRRTGNLTRHFRKLHIKSEAPLTCCDFSFHTKFELQQHAREFHSNGRYVCAKCDRSFNKKAQLTRHELKHTGKKELKCTALNCNYATDHVSNMSRHCDTHNHMCTHERLLRLRARRRDSEELNESTLIERPITPISRPSTLFEPPISPPITRSARTNRYAPYPVIKLNEESRPIRVRRSNRSKKVLPVFMNPLPTPPSPPLAESDFEPFSKSAFLLRIRLQFTPTVTEPKPEPQQDTKYVAKTNHWKKRFFEKFSNE